MQHKPAQSLTITVHWNCIERKTYLFHEALVGWVGEEGNGILARLQQLEVAARPPEPLFQSLYSLPAFYSDDGRRRQRTAATTALLGTSSTLVYAHVSINTAV